jgi:periplasmic nitrate reductase NapD
MSILGAIVRVRPEHRSDVILRLRGLPGVDLALDPGDGRLVLVIEDVEANGVAHEAANTIEQIAQWRDVLNISLVYEYSGPDAPTAPGSVRDYREWRSGAPACAALSIDNDNAA